MTRQEAIEQYEIDNNAGFMGCMENDDELVFKPDHSDELVFVWWIESKGKLGTFEEYYEENRSG